MTRAFKGAISVPQSQTLSSSLSSHSGANLNDLATRNNTFYIMLSKRTHTEATRFFNFLLGFLERRATISEVFTEGFAGFRAVDNFGELDYYISFKKVITAISPNTIPK